MFFLLQRLKKNVAGVTALEYALIAALIAVVITAGVKLVGTNAATKFNAIATSLQ